MNNLIKKIKNRILNLNNTNFNKKISNYTNYKIKKSNSYIHDEDAKNISNVWDECSQEINRIFFEDNSNFFKNDLVKIHLAMPQPSLANNILRELSNDNYGMRLLNLIQDSPMGSPELLQNFPLLSTTTLTHIANIHNIHEELNFDVTKRINFIDFGGGFGGLGRAILNCNKLNKVTIIDIPKMLEVQNAYIDNSSFNSENASFVTVDQLPSEEYFDVFNATFSLSESPLYVRDKIKNYLKTNVESFFIVFQSSFDGHDNELLFEEFTNELSSIFLIEKKLYKWYAPRTDAFLLTGKKIR